MSLPLQEFVLRITRRRIFFLRQVSLPWVPEVFSPVWRGASSAAGRHVFGLWQKSRAAKPETAHEKPLAPRVKFPLQEFFWGELSPGNAIGLTAQYLHDVAERWVVLKLFLRMHLISLLNMQFLNQATVSLWPLYFLGLKFYLWVHTVKILFQAFQESDEE